jgi:N-acetylmuramate 1-kinase
MELVFELNNEQETCLLARDLALCVKSGDILALNGDLGSGKSAFARHFIRAVSGAGDIEVPSPTFTLMQIYDTPRFPIVHADLYRIKSPDELEQLGWDEAGDGAVVLVEWADRLGSALDTNALHITFAMRPLKGAECRRVTLKCEGDFAERITRFLKARQFLDNAGWGAAERLHMQGDASSRSYERLILPRHRAVFMNAPVKSDAKNENTYANIAHIAQNMVPFVAMSEGLRSAGISAPLVEAADLKEGFLILEDLGNEGIVDKGAPIPERYALAVELLADLHSRPRARVLPAADSNYTIPTFTLEAMQAEIALLLEWYVPMKGGGVPASEKWAFQDAWTPLLAKQANLQETWVLRDYHSPNLLWLPERDGLERIGVIDFQDALIGPSSYDLVSLTQDARVTVSPELENKLLAHYVAMREARDAGFNRANFAESYAVMGAERAVKILGIFARLNKRDGKPGYLKHLPRIYDYLYRNLRHASLKQVKTWCDHRLINPSAS